MTKKEILIAICEVPGWAPTHESSSIETTLRELHDEGWIIPRLDGWEATTTALEHYPHFEVDEVTGALFTVSVPSRDEQGRPEYEVPPAEEKKWEHEVTLHSLIVGPHQEVRSPIEIPSWTKGLLAVSNVRPDAQAIEVEFTAKLRRVP